MAVQLAARKTFWTLQLQGEGPRRRSQGAPPSLWATEAAPKLGKPRKRTRQTAVKHRAREQRRAEQNILEEYAATARHERRALLTAGLMIKSKQAQLTSARGSDEELPTEPRPAWGRRALTGPGREPAASGAFLRPVL